MRTRGLTMALFCCLLSAGAKADVVYVQSGESIQNGILQSAAGDTVLVAEGVYVEVLVVSHPLTLLSESGPLTTVIDADGAPQHVVTVEQNADGSTIEGFTIRGANGRVGVVVNRAEQVVVRGNIVEHNSSGVHVHAPLAVIEDNVVRDNVAGKGVAGIWAWSATVRNNWVERNSGTVVVYLVEGSFSGNVVTGHVAHRVLELSYVNCSHNTLVDNEGDAAARILDTLFEHNVVEQGGPGVALECLGAQIASCNVFWGSATPFEDDCGLAIGEDDNIYADPLFCDSENGDYRLAANSPAAVGSCGLIGALPVGCGVAAILASESAPPARPALRAYPNPARAHVSLELSGVESRKVHIFDVGGRLVDTVLLRSGRGNWDAREVPAGVYWLRVDGAIGAEARLVLAR